MPTSDVVSSAGIVGESGPNFNQASDIQRFGNQGDQIISPLRGKYDELLERGRVFVARVNTAASIVVNSALTNAATLWNPTGSTINVKLLKINMSVGIIGTPILNGFTFSYLTNTGPAIGTGAPIVTFTQQAVINLKLGMGYSAQCLFAPAVCTFTTNPAVLVDLGLGHHLEGAAASGQLYQMSYDPDGTIMIPPGCSLSFGSTIASSITFYTSFIFAEVPLPSGGW